jgi:hypothetical protein
MAGGLLQNSNQIAPLALERCPVNLSAGVADVADDVANRLLQRLLGNAEHRIHLLRDVLQDRERAKYRARSFAGPGDV